MPQPQPVDVLIKDNDPATSDILVKGALPGTLIRLVGQHGSVTDVLVPPSPFAVNFFAGAAPVLAPVQPTASPLAAAQPPVVYEPILSESHDPCTKWRLLLNVACIAVFATVGALQLTPLGEGVRNYAFLGGLLWLFYVQLSLCQSSDASALRNHMPPMELLAFTARLRAAPPQVWAEIECFHVRKWRAPFFPARARARKTAHFRRAPLPHPPPPHLPSPLPALAVRNSHAHVHPQRENHHAHGAREGGDAPREGGVQVRAVGRHWRRARVAPGARVFGSVL